MNRIIRIIKKLLPKYRITEALREDLRKAGFKEVYSMTTVFKAQPTGDQVIADLDLRATEAVPEHKFDSTPEAEFTKFWRAFYAEQGKTIADALSASLPGGTLDALLVEMLDRKRSLLRVRP